MTGRAQRVRAQGFALAATLWLLAGLTLLVASVGSSVLTMARTNRDAHERLELLLAEQRAVADVGYLLLTHKTLGAGVQVGAKPLLLDGSTRYRLIDDGRVAPSYVQLQDQHGLIGLNGIDGSDLERLLQLCGATPAQAAALSDAVLDYTDADHLKHLHGAEATDYVRAGEVAPRNAPLLDRAELGQVLGWRAFMPRWEQSRCADGVSLMPNRQINLWTAPVRVLQALGLSAEQAAFAVQERERMRQSLLLSPFLLAWRDANETGGLGATRFMVRSRGQVRLTLSREGSTLQRELVLERGGYSHVQPLLRAQYAWVQRDAAPAGEPPDGQGGAVARFTDNLASYFQNTVAAPPSAHAQDPAVPAVQP